QHSDCKGETRGDDAQAMAYGCQGEAVEPRADPPCRPAKQPFDAKAQSDEHGEEQQGPATSTISQFRGNQAGASPKLVRYLGECGGERHDMRAYGAELGVEVMRNRSLNG